MKLRTVVLSLLGAIIISGVVAGFFLPSIMAALTVIPANQQTATTPNVAKQTQNTPLPGQTPTPTMPATTTGKPVAQDNFQRADQTLWGTASDGQNWQGAANQSQSFSIANKAGLIQGQGFFDTTLGGQQADAEILFTSSLSSFQQANIGAVLRWHDPNNWYKAYLDGQKLIILRKIQGVVTRLSDFNFPATPNTSYDLRFQVAGNNLAAKVWRHGTTEPANWMVIAQDNSLTTGQGGIRAFIQPGITIKVQAFLEDTMIMPPK